MLKLTFKMKYKYKSQTETDINIHTSDLRWEFDLQNRGGSSGSKKFNSFVHDLVLYSLLWRAAGRPGNIMINNIELQDKLMSNS